MDILQDNYGRSFSYLRLSVTDVCNFRCRYCLPQGYQRSPRSVDLSDDSILTIVEIENLVRGFVDLGIKKVRLTGGEPTLRTDIVNIVQRISKIPGIATVALTTNGYRLEKLAAPLFDAGLSAINISLDSLQPQRFAQITGSRCFDRVKAGIFEALRVGIQRVKVNVVLLKTGAEQELASFLELLRTTAIGVRFIELMETGTNREYFLTEQCSGEALLPKLMAQGWSERRRETTDGPAREFTHPDYTGSVGIIAPYSKDFCANCNRLRVSSRGRIKLCLFGDGDFPLRPWLQTPEQRPEIAAQVRRLIGIKAPTHRLSEGQFGSTQHLASIGG